VHYKPVIHQRFKESKIQVVMLPLKGYRANQTKLYFLLLCKKMREKCKLRVETGLETFLKAQIAVSEVLGEQHFNKTLLACAKRQLKAAIFKTGEKPILWQEQFKDFKEDYFLKTVSCFPK